MQTCPEMSRKPQPPLPPALRDYCPPYNGRRLSVWCVGLAVIAGCQPKSTPPAAEDIRLPVPAFALTERSGKRVTNADLAGKAWVASFVFTRCTGPCPAVTATMARLQSEIGDQPGVRLVTFTVDPGRDDPAELTRYAANFRADPERWLFLTGSEAEIHALLKDGFKVAVERSTAKNPDPGQEFDHSTRLAVVDKHGQIRGYFRGLADEDEAGFTDNLRRLQTKLADLARE